MKLKAFGRISLFAKRFITAIKTITAKYMRLSAPIRWLLYVAPVIGIAALQPLIPLRFIRGLLAVLFQLLIVGLIAVFIAKPVHAWLQWFRFSTQDCKRLKILSAVFLIGGLVFFLIYFYMEQDIKVYETATYWEKTIEGQSLITKSIPEYLLSVRDSFSQEYSDFSVFPLVLFAQLFGVSFTSYVLSIYLFYYLPACLLLVISALRLSAPVRGKAPGAVSFILCFCICALSADLLWPVLRGYTDIAGVLYMTMLWNLTLHWDSVEFNWKQCAVYAMLSTAMLLVRRWYVFYVIAFYSLYLIYGLARMVAQKRFTWKALARLTRSIGVILGFSCILLLALNPAVFPALFHAYSLSYSAYGGLSVLGNLWELVKNNSIFISAAACIGAWIILRHKETRLAGLHLLLSALCAAVWFCLIQNMYHQQRYMVIPAILLFACALADFAVQYAYRTVKPLLAIALGVVVGFNFLFAHIPALSGYARMARPFTTAIYGYPYHNGNTSVIRLLVNDLAVMTGGSSKKVYIVGANDALSPELLRRSNMPKNTDATPYVLNNSIVDLRDGFPVQLFLADYVLVNDPFHKSFETRQQVSYQVYDMLLNDPAVSEYYELQTAYHELHENILVFKKIRPVDAACVNVLRARLLEYYPDQPYVYQPDYFVALFQADGFTQYAYNPYWNGNIILKKEPGLPLITQWETAASFSELSFTLSCWEPDFALILENQDGEIARMPVTYGVDVPYSFNIAGSRFVRLTIDIGEGGKEVSTNIILGHLNGGLY